MGLKPDHWIRKMAHEHAMIEPFEERQVREGVISYGLSSYGYDVRVSDEFRIFTPNPYNTVVDPKQLDERSLIPFKGDVCIIPPNSFALAVTVEYFRIPRSVLTITVGKSTYARCFAGNTRVALVDGTSTSLEEMALRAERGERFFGYSVGPFGRIIVTELMAPRFIGRDALVEIVLDNNESVFCTPDHEFITRDGQLRQANDLRVGDSLMPLYRQVARGYEMVYQPLNGQLHPTHRLADEWNLRHDVYENTPNTHRYPIDVAASNGNPSKYEFANNHKVQAIRELPGDHDVYCLTVPEAGNFALEAGVFVKNCGIITNVTPFEPEWEGYVTLEISNTSPLPAKIYANEGIAQVVFLESDEECETSYADRKGKYNKQTGITLPRL